MHLIDTHAHLNFEAFENDLPAVIENSIKNHVITMINIGADIESCRQVVNLNLGQITSYATIGIHPHEAIKIFSIESIHKYLGELEQIYQTSSSGEIPIVGIGECGLDYFFGKDNEYLSPILQNNTEEEIIKVKEKIINIQKQLFQAQVDLARKLSVPLVIHCRDAYPDIFNFDYSNLQGVFHSFSSTWENAQKILDLGFYLGINCTITYPKNDHLREVVKNAPLERLLTETDCPFLPPQSQRGQRNEPANIVEVVKTIAEVKGVNYEEVAKASYKNAVNLFHFRTP